MKLSYILNHVVRPANEILGDKFGGAKAEIMLLAIGLQESRFVHRKQVGGPAHGFWQFENGGGVRGVVTHSSSRPHLQAACSALGYDFNKTDFYNVIPHNDLLACIFARLLLFTDPRPLPEIGQAGLAWDYYIRNWRPGKPHPDTWPGLYMQASSIVASN